MEKIGLWDFLNVDACYYTVEKLLSLILPLISSEIFKYQEAAKLMVVDASFPKFQFLIKCLDFIIGINTISNFSELTLSLLSFLKRVC